MRFVSRSGLPSMRAAARVRYEYEIPWNPYLPAGRAGGAGVGKCMGQRQSSSQVELPAPGSSAVHPLPRSWWQVLASMTPRRCMAVQGLKRLPRSLTKHLVGRHSRMLNRLLARPPKC